MCLALAAACHAAPQLLHHGVAHHAALGAGQVTSLAAEAALIHFDSIHFII